VSGKLPWFLRAPGGVPARERVLTADERGALQAKIDAKLEACRQGYEKANSSEERAFYVFSALNFCAEDRPLPSWLRTAVTAMARSQLPPLKKELVFLLNERLLIMSLAAEYKARGVSNAVTEAEQDVAERFGLSVEGLRKKRYRYRKTLGMGRGKRGRARS
jgi:chorismate mutase